MKKVIAIIMAVLTLLLTVAACAEKKNQEEAPVVLSGMYILQDDEMGPYVVFNTDALSWFCGAGLLYSFSVSGTYTIRDGLVEARMDDYPGTIITFRPVSASELQVASVEKDPSPNAPDWFQEGETLVCRSDVKDQVFGVVCSEDDALEWAKQGNAVTFENLKCTAGKNLWDSFYQSVCDGKPASILCANYYTQDQEFMNGEKDQYPRLFFRMVAYDGNVFTVKTRACTEETLEQDDAFDYLLHFTGEAPRQAAYLAYDVYVLVDDPDATWDGIVWGLLSSQGGGGYRHCTVYYDTFE